jgi:hypothetical protein
VIRGRRSAILILSRNKAVMIQSPRDRSRCFSRRALIAAVVSAGPAMAAPDEKVVPDPNCPGCSGVGRIPVTGAKPFVWVKSTPQPRWESVVGERPCPACQSGGDPAAIAAEMREQAAAALVQNKQWEERTGWKLALVVTRHAAVHTQLSPAQARQVGTALETLTLHLKKVTDSLVLTPSRPDTLGLVLLWEQDSWNHFRKVMEGLYRLEELGESWASARQYNAYDHFVTPHMVETPQSIRTRPPSCGAVFLTARRQLSLTTERKAPFWLTEGFGARGDHLVHKLNRWFTVYSVKQVPVGDWLAEARKLVAESRQRPWPEIMKRELRDWEPEDHFQTMSMAGFLLESEPAKFLDLARRLASGEKDAAAIESAYRAPLDDLAERWSRWLLAQR